MNQDELSQYIKGKYKGIQPYQTVEYNGKIIHRGTESCWLSWDNIQKFGINWNDKKVCDVGSYFGYFSTKVLRAGAAEVVAIDQNDQLLEVCATVLKANGFSNFRCLVNKFVNGIVMPNEHFDVLLVLNVLHHIKRDSGEGYQAILGSMFTSADELVFEINESEINDVVNAAQGRKETRIKSHRPQRWILHFTKT
jgi:2-polyprenyl-3-methyl-5-hydroxy-6-metoxy-1,4-benzoquinol methylase